MAGFLPGWALNAAYIIHSDEALLATGFIFLFHFFHTHLRPEAFPMDPVIFTGSMPLERFKASGKPVVAWGSGYNQKQYYLAAQANEVLMHPLGAVYLDGFGRLRNYYLDALDKLGVGVSLIKVGTFKSAAEPFIANGPSPAAQEADSVLYQGLWATYTDLSAAQIAEFVAWADQEIARRLRSNVLLASAENACALCVVM